MLKIVSSILSLVGSGPRSIVPAKNGYQCADDPNPLLTCNPKTVTCSPKTEPKVAKNFERKYSIPIQFCLSKNDNIQIHQYIEMLQDLNPSTCSSLAVAYAENFRGGQVPSLSCDVTNQL